MADIPINAAHRRVQYTSVGSVGPYSFSFAILDEGDLAVYDATTLKTLTTHYTVSITLSTGTGSITFTSGNAPTSGNIVTIISDQAVARTTDFTTAGDYRATAINDELDRLTIIQQQLESLVRRTPQLDVFSNRDVSDSGAGPLAFPYGSTAAAVTAQADAFIKFDALGTSLETSSTGAAQSLAGDGTVLLPYYSYSADPNSGQFRVGADQLGWSVNGVKGLDLSTTGLTVTGTLAATAITGSGILSIDATTESTSGTTGSIHTDGGLGVAKKLHVVGVATHGGDILSDTDSTDSLGSTGVRWLKLWVDSIQTTANLDVAGNLVVTGNLTINGTTVTNDATNTTIKDPLIELNSGAGSNANDLGLIMERGSTGDNIFMGWDESGDYFAFGTTTATGASTGNIGYSFGEIRASGAVFSGTSSNLGTVTTVDINGGTVDGAVIGGASAAAVTGTTLTANTSITLATGGAMTGVLDSDTMTGATAALLSSSESIKAYVDSSSKAAGISMTWETTTTDTDQGVGKVWANNGTLSSATVLYFDDVERNSVSINALIDSLDDPTATNSATIYIQEAGSATAGVLFKVSGAVTSASTYSKIAVTHQATFGTLSDGDVVGVTIAFSGDDGEDGEGSGTVTQINAGAGFSFSAITTTGTIAVDGNLEDLDALGVVASDGQVIVGTGSGTYAYESGATLRTSIGVAIGSDVQAYDADTLKADTDDTLSGGFQYTAEALGDTGTSTQTLAYANGNIKTITNGGAHTLTPQTGSGVIVVQYTNASDAGSITTSGYDIVTGDDFTTTNGHDFMVTSTVVGAFQHLHVTALQ